MYGNRKGPRRLTSEEQPQTQLEQQQQQQTGRKEIDASLDASIRTAVHTNEMGVGTLTQLHQQRGMCA